MPEVLISGLPKSTHQQTRMLSADTTALLAAQAQVVSLTTAIRAQKHSAMMCRTIRERNNEVEQRRMEIYAFNMISKEVQSRLGSVAKTAVAPETLEEKVETRRSSTSSKGQSKSASPLKVGSRVTVRDEDGEPWETGTVDRIDSDGAALVRCDGWAKSFRFSEIQEASETCCDGTSQAKKVPAGGTHQQQQARILTRTAAAHRSVVLLPKI